MQTNAVPVPPARLPVWPTVAHSYQLAWRHIGDVVRAAWPWMIALAVWKVIGLSVEGDPNSGVWTSTLVNGARYLIDALLAASLAVWWHRRLLDGDAAQRFAMPDWRVLKYALAAWILVMACIVPLQAFGYYAIAIPPGVENAPRGLLLFGLVVAANIAALVVSMRLWVMLPGVAVADLRSHPGQVWARTRRNWWRLTIGSVVCCLPFLIWPLVELLKDQLAGEEPIAERIGIAAHHATALDNAVFGFIELLLGLPLLAFLTLAYRHFFPAVTSSATVEN